MARRPLRVGSTFSGVGGADLGLERAGFELAWTCEWDEWKRSVLAAHWPNIPHYGDIRDLTDPDSVDLLCGGFPCQDLSVAGKRRGFDGERSVLAFEFLRVAESLRPRWLLLENVPGLLSSNGGRDLARLLDEVGTIGYGWAYRILNAQHFGVPQRRRRVFIVARRADAEFDSGAAAGCALRALWESGGGDPTPSWPPREIAPAGTRGGAEGSRIYNRTAQFGQWRDESAARTLTQRDYKSPSHLVMDEPIGFYPTGGSQQGFARTDGVSPTLKRGSTIGAESGTAIAFRKSARPNSADGHETWVDDGVANTLNRFDVGDVRSTHAIVNALDRQAGGPDDNSAQAGHLQTDEAIVRRLTPVECERLMGWPDDWTAPVGVTAPDSKRYAACGDGIVSWVAYWIGQRIQMIEDESW